MTPTSHCYFDYRQAPRWVGALCGCARQQLPSLQGLTRTLALPTRTHCSAGEPGAWYACLPLHVVYQYDPIPGSSQQQQQEAAAAAAGGDGLTGAEHGSQADMHEEGEQVGRGGDRLA